VEATSPCINARTAVDIIAMTAEVLILENDARIAILKNENTMLQFEVDGLPVNDTHGLVGRSKKVSSLVLAYLLIFWPFKTFIAGFS